MTKEKKSKTNQRMDELMIMMDGQIKALTGIATNLLCLSASEATVAKGDANYQQIAKTLEKAAWQKTKTMVAGEPSGVVAAAITLQKRMFQSVYAQMQKQAPMLQINGGPKRKLPRHIYVKSIGTSKVWELEDKGVAFEEICVDQTAEIAAEEWQTMLVFDNPARAEELITKLQTAVAEAKKKSAQRLSEDEFELHDLN